MPVHSTLDPDLGGSAVTVAGPDVGNSGASMGGPLEHGQPDRVQIPMDGSARVESALGSSLRLRDEPRPRCVDVLTRPSPFGTQLLARFTEAEALAGDSQNAARRCCGRGVVKPILESIVRGGECTGALDDPSRAMWPGVPPDPWRCCRWKGRIDDGLEARMLFPIERWTAVEGECRGLHRLPLAGPSRGGTENG